MIMHLKGIAYLIYLQTNCRQYKNQGLFYLLSYYNLIYPYVL